MLSLNRILVILLTIICFTLAFTSLAQAHEDPLQVPWPKGEKVPCRCDILAMPYELCLKGIGREECFKVNGYVGYRFYCSTKYDSDLREKIKV